MLSNCSDHLVDAKGVRDVLFLLIKESGCVCVLRMLPGTVENGKCSRTVLSRKK